MKGWIGSRRWQLFAGLIAIALIAAAYLVGAGSVDTHSAQIDKLQAEVDDTRSELKSTQGELESTQGDLSVAKGEVEVAKEETAEAEEELATERSFKGEGAGQQVADQEYSTDFPWGVAGRAGDFIFKPTDWTQEGEKWILTVEAKNMAHEPKEPFCGGAESMVIDAGENNYTGNAVLGTGSANCGDELQPGTTATYEAEFKMPSSAAPVVVAIYGEYDQEEEAKLWELPH